MNPPSAHGLRARQKLILAAERLFAERGIAGVSLREIAAAAGSRNNNAVQYHFGAKPELLHAVLRNRVEQMERRRGRMLDAAESEGRLGDAGTLLEILCLPHLDLTDETGRHPYASFLCQFALRYWTRPADQIWSEAGGTPPRLRRLVELLLRLLPHLAPEVARSRIMLANLLFLNALVRWDSFQGTANAMPAESIADALEAAKAALTAGAATKAVDPRP